MQLRHLPLVVAIPLAEAEAIRLSRHIMEAVAGMAGSPAAVAGAEVVLETVALAEVAASVVVVAVEVCCTFACYLHALTPRCKCIRMRYKYGPSKSTQAHGI